MPLTSDTSRRSSSSAEMERKTRNERVDHKSLHREGRGADANSRNDPRSQPQVHSSPSGSNTHSPNTLTAQRSAVRERKLRADADCEVHGPEDVTCRRCDTNIKLSTKSSYDPFHWQRHIERCHRRPTKVLNEIRRGGRSKDHRKRSSLSKTNTISPGTKMSLRLRQRDHHDVTPPLTPDDLDDPDSAIKEESPAPDSLSSASEETSTEPETPPIQRPRREIDPTFEDYLVRSRRTATVDLGPSSPISWTSWSWAQLKEPVWVVASYPNQRPLDANAEGLSELYLPRKTSLNSLPSTRSSVHP